VRYVLDIYAIDPPRQWSRRGGDRDTYYCPNNYATYLSK